MTGTAAITEVDKVEIITLQDNYIEITAQDNSAVISRAMAVRNGEINNSIQAEHGFSRNRENHKGRRRTDHALRFRLFTRRGRL